MRRYIQKDIALRFGEYFVLLQNNHVVGGGKVLNPIAEPIKKKHKIEALKHALRWRFSKRF